MKKILKKLSVAALCLAAVFSLAVPAMALPSESYAVLNVRYAPNGTPINSTDTASVEYRAYKVADAVKNSQGGYTYTLTEPFQSSGIDVNGAMDGTQLSNNSAQTYRTLLNQFGTFINNSDGAIVPDTTAVTRAVTISGTPENGIAQLTGLQDGLYLVSTRAVTTISRTQYTAVPFLVNIPYEADGVLNNYLTATVKFTTYTPSDPGNPTPDPEDPPENPPDDPNPPDEQIPDEPAPTTRPDVPEEPDPTENPDTSDEPVIDISDEDVPLVDTPEDPEIEIPDETPPLERLPQTGLLWWPVPVMVLAGAALVVVGLITKRRNQQDA